MGLLTALDDPSAADAADAIVVDGRASSRSALVGRADALAARLAGHDMVAIPAAATLDTVVAVTACLRAGVPAVTVPIDAGPVERRYVLGDSGAQVVVGSPPWDDVDLPSVPVPDTGVGGTGTGGAGVGTYGRRTDAGRPALVMYTSGTTGPPKGAMLSEPALAACLDGLADAWSWSPDDVLVHGLPLFHVHGLVLGVLGALRVGSKVVHTGRPTPERYAAARGSLYFGVPTVWSRVVADPTSAGALRSARLLVSGSAALPGPVFDGLVALAGQRPCERYGMTETLITLSTRFDGERRPGHVGEPLAGVRTRLRADDGTLAARDGETIGGLEVDCTTGFLGYLGRPEATAAVRGADGWFVTGDAATIDPGGFHRIVGRTSIDIIKSGGYKVGAGEVESSLLAHPDVVEAAVIGVPDDDLGERIVAVVVGDIGDPEELIEHVATTLSNHKRPREVRIVDELPRNALGKVRKDQLR